MGVIKSLKTIYRERKRSKFQHRQAMDIQSVNQNLRGGVARRDNTARSASVMSLNPDLQSRDRPPATVKPIKTTRYR